MNCYFVFEGKTEPEVYQHWLKELVPNLKEVDFPNQVTTNNYVQFGDAGLPKIYEVVKNAIIEINELEEKFDYLVVVMDADQLTVGERKAKLYEYLEENLNTESSLYKNLPDSCQMVVLIQQVSIETWFLGNKTFVPTHPKSKLLKEYKEYFDVCQENPELMAADFVSINKSKLFGCSTRAQFHAKYFNEVFVERTRRSYSKSKPKEVIKASYLQQLQKRAQETQHLASFQTFLDFCQLLHSQLHP